MVLNPATPIDNLEYIMDCVDLILVMSVNPGFGGQSFIESQVKKIEEIKAMCNKHGVNPWIEVDGGVGPANAYKVRWRRMTSVWQCLVLFPVHLGTCVCQRTCKLCPIYFQNDTLICQC